MNVRMYYLVIILLICSPVFIKAQIINIENGFSFAKAPNLFSKFSRPYQMSAGIEYMDRGWYNLTTNIGFLKKGGQDRGNYGGFFETESFKCGITSRYVTVNTTFDLKAYTYDNFILYFAIGPRIDFLINNTFYYKDAGKAEIHSSTDRDLNKIMGGLKCGVGAKKQIANLQLGIHAAWLPSFNNMINAEVKEVYMKDHTFSIGASIGYILNQPKGETIYSVKKRRVRNRPE